MLRQIPRILPCSDLSNSCNEIRFSVWLDTYTHRTGLGRMLRHNDAISVTLDSPPGRRSAPSVPHSDRLMATYLPSWRRAQPLAPLPSPEDSSSRPQMRLARCQSCDATLSCSSVVRDDISGRYVDYTRFTLSSTVTRISTQGCFLFC